MCARLWTGSTTSEALQLLCVYRFVCTAVVLCGKGVLQVRRSMYAIRFAGACLTLYAVSTPPASAPGLFSELGWKPLYAARSCPLGAAAHAPRMGCLCPPVHLPPPVHSLPGSHRAPRASRRNPPPAAGSGWAAPSRRSSPSRPPCSACPTLCRASNTPTGCTKRCAGDRRQGHAPCPRLFPSALLQRGCRRTAGGVFIRLAIPCTPSVLPCRCRRRKMSSSRPRSTRSLAPRW